MIYPATRGSSTTTPTITCATASVSSKRDVPPFLMNNTNLSTLLGGVDYSATKLDGSTETVRIRQLPIKQFPTYLTVLEDEPKMVELLCDKPEGWSDSLTPE